MRTTEAVVIDSKGEARLQEVELPPVTRTRARIKTLVGGVSCGTEGDCASGRANYMARPFITGYQAVGQVEEVGSEVKNIAVGDFVMTMGGGLWGMANLVGGSHAYESVSEASDLLPLKSGEESFVSASYGTLGAVAWEGLARMKCEPGSVLLVFGLGMLGQMAGRISQLLGMPVIGVNRSAWKRDAAKEFGFDAVASPDPKEIETALKSFGLQRAKYAFDTTGSQQIIDLALSCLGSRGELSLGGFCPGMYQFDLDFCHSRNLSIHNPVGPGDFVPKFIENVEAGRLNLDALVRTRVRPKEVTSFYSDLVSNHSNYLGAVIDWRT